MGLFDRVSRVVRSNLNAAVSGAEDPEKILDQAIIDMQEDLVQMRQAVAKAIASQKRVQQQYERAQSEANTWQQRAQLALQKGDESLAREALTRKKDASRNRQHPEGSARWSGHPGRATEEKSDWPGKQNLRSQDQKRHAQSSRERRQGQRAAPEHHDFHEHEQRHGGV